MYQSVMAKRQGIGSSGTGFSFVLATIKEVHPDTNICLAQDLQTGDQYQVGLNKRGDVVWPQVGDQWILDRSMGHWALRTKVTETQAPVYTGYYNTMDADLLRLVLILKGLGLVQDGTTTGPVPVIPTVTGSKAQITPVVQQIISYLASAGVVQDGTTAATVPVDTWQEVTLTSGWTAYTTAVRPRYKLNYDNSVSIEGRVIPPGTVTNGATIFTLSTGYRPPCQKYFTAGVADGVSGSLIVGTDGTVKIWDFGATTPVRVLMQCRYSLLP
jgi:uncharacterized membrane protein